jgi:hypothetical protein
MSMPTITPTGDGFDDLEFALIVADFNPARRSRPSRQVEETEAINRSMGIVRHRTHERRD